MGMLHVLHVFRLMTGSRPRQDGHTGAVSDNGL